MININIKIANQELAERLCDALKLPFVQCSIVFDLNFVNLEKGNHVFIIEEREFAWFRNNYKFLTPERIGGILILKSLGTKTNNEAMAFSNNLKVHYLNLDKEENEIIQDIFSFLVQQIDFSKVDPVQHKFVPVYKGTFESLPFTKLFPFLSQKRFSGFITIFPENQNPLLLPIKHGNPAASGIGADIKLEYLEQLTRGSYILFQEIIRPSVQSKPAAQPVESREKDVAYNQSLLSQISLEDIFQDLFSFLYQIFNKYIDERVLDDLIETKFQEYRDLFMDFNFLEFDRTTYEKFHFKSLRGMEEVELLMLFFKDLFEELIAHAPSFNPKELVFKVEELLPYLQKYNLFDKIKDVILDPFSMS